MKLQPVTQNILEWLGVRLGLVPVPLGWSHFGFIAAHALLQAVDKGIVETIGNNRLSAAVIATQCQLNEAALHNLLDVLAAMKLVKKEKENFLLTPSAKKWLLKESPHSLYWLMIFDSRVCIKWMEHAGSFLQTGKGLQYHETLTKEEWFYYQKAMEAVAGMAAREVAQRLHVPKNATLMLDIGGAHGVYSKALCQRHSGVSAVVLDLPDAISNWQNDNRDTRINYQPGNVLTDDLGEAVYDFILMVSVAHHFTESENKMVSIKAFRALKPGGVFVIIEVLKQDNIVYGGNMISALGNFFFALSSTSGLFGLRQIKSWQAEAGFTFIKTVKLLSMPGLVAVCGKKG